MGASTTESASGTLGKGAVADRRGPQTSEGERANGRSALTGRSHRAASESGRMRGRIDANRSVPPGSGRERGRGSTCAVVADRWGSPIRRRGRTRATCLGCIGPNGLLSVFLFLGNF